MFENDTTQFFNSAQSIFVYTSFLFAHHNADGNYIACELNYVYCTQRVMCTCIMTKQKYLQIQRKQKSNDIAVVVVVDVDDFIRRPEQRKRCDDDDDDVSACFPNPAIRFSFILCKQNQTKHAKFMI